MTVVGSLLWKMVGTGLLAVLPVTVKTNSGELIEGDLGGFTPTSLVVADGKSVQEYPFEDLTMLRVDDYEEATGPTYRVTLISGSRIAAKEILLSGNQILIEPRRQNSIRVPIKQVKAIRFRAPLIATDAQWLGLVDRDARGDTLVIRRPGDRLDPQQGVVVAIENDTVAFDLDGQMVSAPIDRLEGLVFGGTQAVNDDAEIQVVDAYGSKWSVLAIEQSRGDQPLQMRLSPSLLHPLPIHQIELIRWTGGVTMLAEEEPASNSFQPYLNSSIDARLTRGLFGPRPDGEEDMILYGGSSIEYRIEPGHRTLAGSFRRHEKVDQASSMTVAIELDGQQVWKEQLNDSGPRGFELPVDRARRMAIKVDSDRDGFLGDTVRVSRPRLLK